MPVVWLDRVGLAACLLAVCCWGCSHQAPTRLTVLQPVHTALLVPTQAPFSGVHSRLAQAGPCGVVLPSVVFHLLPCLLSHVALQPDHFKNLVLTFLSGPFARKGIAGTELHVFDYSPLLVASVLWRCSWVTPSLGHSKHSFVCLCP